MKSNAVIFWILTVYFALVAAMYIIWNLVDVGKVEWSGTTPLLLSGGLAGLIAYYLTLVKKNQGGELHEDMDEADIDDGDPEVGEFSPWSWWPLTLAFAASLFMLGFTLNGNFFIVYFAVPLLIVSVVGWVYEYYRGHFAR